MTSLKKTPIIPHFRIIGSENSRTFFSIFFIIRLSNRKVKEAMEMFSGQIDGGRKAVEIYSMLADGVEKK